jgi:sarcosine oxidase
MAYSNGFDAIVVGLGAMGSAALYHLARRGVKALGIEQHRIAHDLGSSHGTVRAIRKAYFEHPDYVPILNRSYALWGEIEEEASEQLLHLCGLLLTGEPDSEMMRGLETCYAEHNLPHERLSVDDVRKRYPHLAPPENHAAFFDPSGGYVYAEASVRHLIDRAEAHGAEIRIHEVVRGWKADAGGVTVITESGEVTANSLVITLGPWAKPLLGELGVELEIVRKVQFWYDSPNIDNYRPPEFPCFASELDSGFFYGFPALGDDGLKIAEHLGGSTVDDPSDVDRGLRVEEEAEVLDYLRHVFPGLEPRLKKFSVCMYTRSPDEHFIIDTHPEFERVVLAAGFSGHGFKFTPLIGEVLADLAIEGNTTHALDFLRLGRLMR